MSVMMRGPTAVVPALLLPAQLAHTDDETFFALLPADAMSITLGIILGERHG